MDHGPLTFSLLIEENWNARPAAGPLAGVRGPSRTRPGTTAWCWTQHHPDRSFDVHRKAGALPDNPFTHETNPIELRAKARKIPAWQADRYNVVQTLQPSPARSAERDRDGDADPDGRGPPAHRVLPADRRRPGRPRMGRPAAPVRARSRRHVHATPT